MITMKRTKMDLIGQQFGRLKVIEFSHLDKRQAAHWKCLCECGNIAIVRRNSLLGKRVLSCGCYMIDKARERVIERNNKTRLPTGQCNFNIVFNRYKRSAAKRGKEFNLTQEDCKEIMQSICHYCGSPPSQIENMRNTNGAFIYNGIDRKDNDLGYVLDNCIPCCGECNWLKGSTSYDRFVFKIVQIANNIRKHT